MTKSVFPTKIRQMIERAYDRGLDSKKAAAHINASKTAKRLGVNVKATQVRTAFGNITRTIA